MNIKSNVILLLVDIHWGEIDWILPILHKIKERKQDWQIVAVFRSPELLAKREHNYSLSKELEEITDLIVAPAPEGFFGRLLYYIINCLPSRALAYYIDRLFQKIFRTSPGTYYTTFLYSTRYLFPKIVDPENVRIILKDFANDSRFDRKIEECCPQAKIVLFPHATSVLISDDSNQRDNSEDLRYYHTHDLFLVSTKYSADWWKKQHCQDDAIPIGFPRFDKWWVDYILAGDKIKKSEEYQWVKEKKSNNKKIILYFTRHPSPCMLTIETFNYLVRTTLEVVMKQKDAVLLVKPHPNQSIPQLLKILNDFDKKRWFIGTSQAMLLAKISDFVISMHSTCILDSLNVGKPVVEYFQYKETPDDYPEKNDGYLFCKNGKLGSPQRYLEVVAEANTKEELGFFINDYFSSDGKPKNNIWEKQKIKFKEICENKDSASDIAVNLILNDYT